MDAFNPTPPEWTYTAIHALEFCCPKCKASVTEAQEVWLNRRAPVTNLDGRRRFQEFYHCSCQQAWWAWNTDRPSLEKKE